MGIFDLFTKRSRQPDQMDPSKMTSWSLTEHLLSLSPEAYKAATQAPFLLAAAEGRLPKDVLGVWLANDRLYIHSYIRAAGKVLAFLELPVTVPKDEAESAEIKFVDWIVEALVGVRREERFFTEVAGRYGLEINLETRRPIGPAEPRPGTMPPRTLEVVDGGKLPGLVMIEEVFGSVGSSISEVGTSATGRLTTPAVLPWLEAAVMFWGTERCYLDAWSWAKTQQPVAGSEAREDADGGALRKEFIPTWSSDEFAGFVARLGTIIDFAVGKVLERDQGLKEELLRRVEGKWKSLLAAEAAFWPEVD